MWSALKEGVVELAFLRSSVVTDLCKLDFPTVDVEKKPKILLIILIT